MAKTMANKNNSKRKFVAVGLGVIGIAGLSVASAATLNVNAAAEVAIGSDTFVACAASADVDYTYDAPSGLIDQINVTGIENEAGVACDGATIEVELQNEAGTEVVATGSGVVDNGTFSFSPSSALPVTTDLGEVTVIVR